MDGLIALLLFAGVWFGLSLYYKKNGHGVWKRHLAGCAMGLLATVIFIIIVAPNTNTQEQTTKPGLVVSDSVVHDLGVTPDQYAERFNALMVELKRPHRMKIEITDGSVRNSFKSTFSERLAVIGTIDKASGKMLEVVFVGSGNNTLESGLDVFVTGTVTLAAAVRNSTFKDVTAQVLELSKQFDEDVKKEMVEKTYGDVKFFHIRNDTLGTWYGASAAGV